MIPMLQDLIILVSFPTTSSFAILFYLQIHVMLLQLVVVRFMFNFQSTASRGFKKQWNILHKFVLMFLYSKKLWIMFHYASSLFQPPHPPLQVCLLLLHLHRWCPEWAKNIFIHRSEHLLLSIEDNNLI